MKLQCLCSSTTYLVAIEELKIREIEDLVTNAKTKREISELIR